jgi:hypothetical protein
MPLLIESLGSLRKKALPALRTSTFRKSNTVHSRLPAKFLQKIDGRNRNLKQFSLQRTMFNLEYQ